MDWITSIKEIRKAQENNQLVVFVGAGVSKNSGVPTWWELIKRFAVEMGYDKCSNCGEKTDMCKNQECKKRYEFTQDEFLRIPEYYYQQHKEETDEYYSLIQNTLRGGTGTNLIDDEIFKLLPHHIITTNYDSLLEDSAEVNSQLYTVVAQDSDLLSKASEHYIIKMHGDLEVPKTIVLKESDYIDYEQNHPLISTFIKSLLVNHSFMFLGYSLNDYNLNLIIGWINYFRKIHDIKERPSNFLIDSKSATSFEECRLADKNIYVIDTSLLPDEIVEKTNATSILNNSIGQKLLAYLKCISNEEFIQGYIPLEERLIEKYELLQAYEKISFQDLISVHPFGRAKFLDTELVFYERAWFDKIGKILGNTESPVVKVFQRAGISAIHFYDDNTQIEVPSVFENDDNIFKLYLENEYIKLDEELTTYTNPVQKLYYYHLLGRNKEELENVINENSKNQPLDNYVSVVLHKTRERTALLSLYDRQEEKTIELEKILNSAVPKFRGAVSFLRMLFESMAKNLYKMEKILEKHEKRYEYDSNTIYCDNVFENLWELKSYAYDYYFFLIKNGIPLHYFSDSKEYLSYYIRAVLCTYSPIKERTDEFNMPVARNVERYTLGEIEIDMLVKYTDSQSLQAWIKKYSVQALEIDKEINIVNRFANLCNSFVQFKIRYWLKQLTNFAVVLCLANLNEEQKRDIYITIATTMEKFAIELPHVNEELFETVEYIVRHMNIEDQGDAYQKLIDVITNENVYSTIVNRHSSKIQYIFRKAGKFATQQDREKIESKIMSNEDIKEVCKKIYNFRFLLSKENCRMFFNEHSELLSVSQIFNLLIDGMLDYNEQLLDKFVETIRKEDAARKKNPAMRTFPDWLMVTLEYSLLLKLLKFPIDLNLLSPYVEYSEHLQFMLKPEEFDYSKVDTKNYMWQNLIYSDEYKHYFVDNRGEILTEQLKSIFDLGVETVAQQKIIYGILLADNELRQY